MGRNKLFVVLSPLMVAFLLGGSFNAMGRLHRGYLEGEGKIRIGILSKHLRLMQETNPEYAITLTFPKHTEWHNLEKNSRKQRTLLKGLRIFAEPELSNLKKPKRLVVKTLRGKDLPPSLKICGEGYFQCNVNGERRKYPLPLEIKNREKLALFVHERAELYAIDSALAETGSAAAPEMEAVMALAKIILARTEDRRYLKHRDCHFCDLTCCQVYRGRTEHSFSPKSIVENPEEMALYFHASNGGKMFSDSVFSSRAAAKPKPAEYSYNDRKKLSRKLHQNWNRTMNIEELNSILSLNRGRLLDLNYSPASEQMFLIFEEEKVTMAPETFRLKVNRKKGWNFLKSNNYSMTRRGGELLFSGSGLGHGVGLSMEGAIELAELGYSRDEILEHYFPRIKLQRPQSQGFPGQFVILNDEGKILKVSKGVSFLNRKVPPGSVFKVVTSLYLALHRPEMLGHSFHCSGNWNVGGEVINCWQHEGHGETDFNSALSSSCNLFFASLTNEIDQRNFLRFLSRLEEQHGIAFEIDRGYDRAGFAKVLCGLDFEVKVKVRSLVKLACLVNDLISGKATGVFNGLGQEEIDTIKTALHSTFISGTASLGLKEDLRGRAVWGKTGTVMTGTNRHLSYGIFMGGYEDIVMVAIMPRSHGEVCAQNSYRIMCEETAAQDDLR